VGRHVEVVANAVGRPRASTATTGGGDPRAFWTDGVLVMVKRYEEPRAYTLLERYFEVLGGGEGPNQDGLLP
jgi:hypothetical protein